MDLGLAHAARGVGGAGARPQSEDLRGAGKASFVEVRHDEAPATRPKVPGGKRLVYTHLSLPMTPIADFARLGETDPMFAELARICAAHRGLWSREAEDFLLARAPKLA